MKILISTLLLTLAVLLDFHELSASSPGGGSSSKKRKSPTKRAPTPNYENLVHKVIKYEGKYIELMVDRGGSGKNVKIADYKDNAFPTAPDYKKGARFLCRRIEIEGYKLVECLDGEGELMGVRPPNMRAFLKLINLEPDDSTWFITIGDKTIKAIGNPAELRAREVHLMPENLHHLPKYSSNLITEKYQFLGIPLKLYKWGSKEEIVGADLDTQPQQQ